MSLPKFLLPCAIASTAVYRVKDFQNCKDSFTPVPLLLLQTKEPQNNRFFKNFQSDDMLLN